MFTFRERAKFVTFISTFVILFPGILASTAQSCQCTPDFTYCGRELSDECRQLSPASTGRNRGPNILDTDLWYCHEDGKNVTRVTDCPAGCLIFPHDSFRNHQCHASTSDSSPTIPDAVIIRETLSSCGCVKQMSYCGNSMPVECHRQMYGDRTGYREFDEYALYYCRDLQGRNDSREPEMQKIITCPDGCTATHDHGLSQRARNRSDHCTRSSFLVQLGAQTLLAGKQKNYTCRCKPFFTYCGQALLGACRTRVKVRNNDLYTCLEDGQSVRRIGSCPSGCVIYADGEGDQECRSPQLNTESGRVALKDLQDQCSCRPQVRYCGHAVPDECKSRDVHDDALFFCGLDGKSVLPIKVPPCRHGCHGRIDEQNDFCRRAAPQCHCRPGAAYCGRNLPETCVDNLTVNSAKLYRCSDTGDSVAFSQNCPLGCMGMENGTDKGVVHQCVPMEADSSVHATNPRLPTGVPRLYCLCNSYYTYCGATIKQECAHYSNIPHFDVNSLFKCGANGTWFEKTESCTLGCMTYQEPDVDQRCDAGPV